MRPVLSILGVLCLTFSLAAGSSHAGLSAFPTVQPLLGSMVLQTGTAAVDTDGDGIPDDVDTDDDNDGVVDANDACPLDPTCCEDVDGDVCDDCSVGTDGFGPLADNNPNNDGLDIDDDGLCYIGDLDDDSDGIPDVFDNCPVTFNQNQLNTDTDGFGDACDCEPENPSIPTGDADGDGYGTECDCDDGDANIFPGNGCDVVSVEGAPWTVIKQYYR